MRRGLAHHARCARAHAAGRLWVHARHVGVLVRMSAQCACLCVCVRFTFCAWPVILAQSVHFYIVYGCYMLQRYPV